MITPEEIGQGLVKQFNLIQVLTNMDDVNCENWQEQIGKRLRNLIEEIGELSTAVSVETGEKKRVLNESSLIESVDVVICSLALFYACRGNNSDLVNIMETKLSKWQKNIEKHRG